METLQRKLAEANENLAEKSRRLVNVELENEELQEALRE